MAKVLAKVLCGFAIAVIFSAIARALVDYGIVTDAREAYFVVGGLGGMAFKGVMDWGRP